ncbi:MAG: phosphotransferase [Acidimicrobiia bacterium]
MTSAARLLRRMHDASEGFAFDDYSGWYVEPAAPLEVMCHGDFAPYNCTIVGGEVAGVFDFDTARPGPRLADVGYAAYRWVPLDRPADDSSAALTDQKRRLHLFCDACGDLFSTGDVLEASVEQVTWMVGHMVEQADSGNEMFQRHIEEGHLIVYRDALEYMTEAHDHLL